MDKLTSPLLAAVLCAFLSVGAVHAADSAKGNEPGSSQQNPAATAPAPQSPQRDVMKEKDQYFSELQKCDALQGVAEKQQCVDATRKRFGQL
jgi:hypothetical protein